MRAVSCRRRLRRTQLMTRLLRSACRRQRSVLTALLALLGNQQEPTSEVASCKNRLTRFDVQKEAAKKAADVKAEAERSERAASEKAASDKAAAERTAKEAKAKSEVRTLASMEEQHFAHGCGHSKPEAAAAHGAAHGWWASSAWAMRRPHANALMKLRYIM